MGGRFAGKVAGVKFLEGGVDVAAVEPYTRDDALMCVDLDDAEHLGVERVGPLIGAGPSGTRECQAFPTDCDDVRRSDSELGPEVVGPLKVCDRDIATLSEPD